MENQAKRPAKTDIPFRSDPEVQDLVARFEACTWPYERWTHRAHLAVAVAYLRQYSPEDALERLRRGIRNYNQTRGDPNGYHETITVCYTHLVRVALESRDAMPAFRVANELDDLLGPNILRAYYSPERLFRTEAKATWLPPDLKALPPIATSSDRGMT